jgi:hypothetical protein
MSNSTTLHRSASRSEAQLSAAIAGLLAAASHMHQRWQQARRMHAHDVAIRMLDPRTRRDLGLHVAGNTCAHGRSLLAEYERMRW